MFFFFLDIICWILWDLLWWSVQYLGPLVLLLQLVRLIRADADLSLLMYERFGQMPCEYKLIFTTRDAYIAELNLYQLIIYKCKYLIHFNHGFELHSYCKLHLSLLHINIGMI